MLTKDEMKRVVRTSARKRVLIHANATGFGENDRASRQEEEEEELKIRRGPPTGLGPERRNGSSLGVIGASTGRAFVTAERKLEKAVVDFRKSGRTLVVLIERNAEWRKEQNRTVKTARRKPCRSRGKCSSSHCQ